MPRSLKTLLVLLALLPSTLLAQQPSLVLTEEVVNREITAYRGGETPTPIPRGDLILHPFGLAQPVLTCAPLRACAIVLEDGEEVLSTALGDTARWRTHLTTMGDGRPVVIVKTWSEPGGHCDLSTNMLISTNRRLYELTLTVPPCDPDLGDENPELPYSRIEFYYPEDTLRRWDQQAREQAQSRHTPPSTTLQLDDLDWSYSWASKKKGFPWEPTAVFNDRVNTYIKLPEAALLGELPVAFGIDVHGEESLLTTSPLPDDKTTLRVSSVPEKILLVLPGGGKHRQELEIEHTGER